MINNGWDSVLTNEYNKAYYIKLMNYINQEYNEQTIFPQKEDIFNAFKLCDYKDTKVVIIGQDPYHNEKQAHGLAFSVLNGNKIPPSLLNIYKEMKTDLGIDISTNTNLTSWAKQGVLLINTILTVRAHQPLSHKDIGWETFFREVINVLNESAKPIVFVLWGNNAKTFKMLINEEKHTVLTSSHPSPLSARHSFFGSKVFSKINKVLNESGLKSINFKVE